MVTPNRHGKLKQESAAQETITGGGAAGSRQGPAYMRDKGMHDAMPKGPRRGPVALLKTRRFGPLWMTQFLSAFNDNALKNALVLWLAYKPEMATGLPAGMLIPLAGALFILPFFLGSATAGELADSHDKSKLIRIIKLSEVAVMAVAAAAVLTGSTWVLLGLLFVMGIEATFFGPIKYAILPNLLTRHELLLGNALVEAGTFFAILGGTIAGMLIATQHGAGAVSGLIILVALSAYTASRYIPSTAPSAPDARIEWNFIAATGRLIAAARRERTRFRSILGISWFWLVGATYLSQFPTYVKNNLGAEEAVVTLFLTAFSVGVGVGSLGASRILKGRISASIAPWGALGIALFSIDLWLASPVREAVSGDALITIGAFLARPTHWRILVDMFAIAASGGIFALPLYALLQTAGDERRTARAIGANNVVNAAAMVLSAIAVIGLLALGVSVPGLFLLTGIATIAVAGLFWRLRGALVPSPVLVPGEANDD
jgi:acyl-[acyl-carrier-protein]-phospholipid O-acyltransferase/long-chain-fatty-acid--[acyl-carrier-protein] ligase